MLAVMNNLQSYYRIQYVFLITLSLILFILGNLVYAPILNLPWYWSSISSEFLFVLMYTIVDCGNMKYKYKFAIPHVILLLAFYLPVFLPLFYSTKVQLYSVSCAIVAILVNSNIINLLYSKGLKKILCSRISTFIASVVDILLFSTLLHIGLEGALLMAILRPIYIMIIPRLIFNK